MGGVRRESKQKTKETTETSLRADHETSLRGAQLGELDRGLGWQIVMPRYAQTGGLFAPESFGHFGNTGTSIFMNREQDLCVILFTNATRQGYKRMQYVGPEYDVTMAMPESIHRAIKEDLF